MFSDRQYREVTGIFLMLISIVLLLSLISFSTSDIKLLSKAKPVYNIIGPLGTLFGDFLRGAFGYLSFITVVIFASAGWGIMKKGIPSDLIERIFSLLFLMITASVMMSLIHENAVPYFSGGYIGIFLSKLLTGILGKIGAFIVVLMLNIIGLILLGIVSLSSIILYFNKKDRKTATVIKKIFSFEHSKSIPLNDLDTVIERKHKKLPWIIKKRIIIGTGDFDLGHADRKDVKLIEHREFSEDLKNLLPRNTDESHGREFEQDNHNMSMESRDPDMEYDIVTNIDDEDMDYNPAFDMQSQISYVNYTEDAEPVKIETNRIKSVVLEHDIRPAMIIDQHDDEEEEEGEEINEMVDPGVEENKSNGIYYDDYRASSFIPRVFDKFILNEEYSVPINFLNQSTPIDAVSWKAEAKRNSELLIKTLNDFAIEARVINVHRGPVITLYEIQIAPGIKVNRIVGLSDDIAMALAAYKVRIVAPIPGKSAIGVEIPNSSREIVTMGDIIRTEEYKQQTGKLKIGLGKDILGKPVTFDLKKQPHLLIAGATGAGKSICLNSVICDLIYNYDPNYVRFILIDPKMVELQLYNGLPHLLTPVITESYLAPKALKWATHEMERRYKLLSEFNVRDIDKYNERTKAYQNNYERLPYIIIVIDELADLMMIAAKEIEGFITRIAQKARAVGIHLILATQRPSVDIITGVIKANFPARIAFQVPQKIDSRTILDHNGAETLLGRGDMLYQSPVTSFPVRVQGAYITEEEILKIVRHTRKYGRPKYVEIEDSFDDEDADEFDESEDELFLEAIKIVEETKKASASYLQRRLSIGYNRAARIIELMEDRGYVGPQQGSKPREVFI